MRLSRRFLGKLRPCFSFLADWEMGIGDMRLGTLRYSAASGLGLRTHSSHRPLAVSLSLFFETDMC